MTKTILLADDSVTIQKVVELTFMDEDFRVTAVSNGAEAIARLGESKPDVVIADVHMPGAGGFEVCRRSKELYPAVPGAAARRHFRRFRRRRGDTLRRRRAPEEAVRLPGADAPGSRARLGAVAFRSGSPGLDRVRPPSLRARLRLRAFLPPADDIYASPDAGRGCLGSDCRRLARASMRRRLQTLEATPDEAAAGRLRLRAAGSDGEPFRGSRERAGADACRALPTLPDLLASDSRRGRAFPTPTSTASPAA